MTTASTPAPDTQIDALAATLASDDDAETTAPRASGPGPAADARYEPLELLGRGGMGEVRLWRDRRVGRELAVKVAHDALGEDGRRRFAREAILQARLEHPAFVPVYDVARDAAGGLYFTMRRVRGRTLREVLAAESEGRERVPRTRLLAAFTQLCLAVDYAHARGVVHQDIKPENVMLGDFGEVYLLDWGVAKLVGEAGDDAAALAALDGEDRGERAATPATEHGSVLGTPGYMAPEQVQGENATLDGRADVYALGAVLFELLALEPMNAGRTFGALAMATLAGARRSPAERAPGRSVPPELDAIVRRATEPDRDARYPTARAIADAVERFLEGDRDQASRRARAAELARDAGAALEAAGGDAEKRASAGQRAAKALALDEAQGDARRVLLAAIAEPPATPPAEAVAQTEAARRGAERASLHGYAVSSLVLKVALVALFVAYGVRSASAVLAIVAGFAGALVTLREARRATASDTLITVGFVFTCLENACFTRLTSPFVSIPIAVLAALIGVAVYAPASRRRERVVLAVLVLVAPWVLEASRVLSPTWIAAGGTTRIVPHMASFALPGWFLTLHATAILAAVVTTLHPRFDAARRAELRLHSTEWMLRRVLDAG